MTRICHPIRFLSRGTSDYISRIYEYNLRVSELGLTNHLIFYIIDFYQGYGGEVNIWHARNERLSGADICLIIEHPNNICKSYLIQAKKNNKAGKYPYIEKWQNNHQYLNLITWARYLRAFPIYLLYNSEHNCQNYNPHFGMAICRAEWIRDFRRNQHNLLRNQRTPKISFNDISNDNELFPFHYLFCDIPFNSRYPDPLNMNCDAINMLLETGRYRQVIGEEYFQDNENIDPFLEDFKIPYDKLPRHIIKIRVTNHDREENNY